jgi:SAM-dependent methyltransferase
MSVPISRIQDLQTSVTDSYKRLFDAEGALRETDAFYAWVLDKLAPLAGPLLDVACGEGYLVRHARRRGIEVAGVDLSSRAVQTAQRQLGRNVVAVGVGEMLPFPSECFELVTNLGSLEHFISPEQGLNEMRRVLRWTGRAALLLPNSFYWPDIVWHVWRTGYPVSHKQEIERFATAGQWCMLIEASGFRILRAHKYNLRVPTIFGDMRWYFRTPQKLLCLPLTPRRPCHPMCSILSTCACQ